MHRLRLGKILKLIRRRHLFSMLTWNGPGGDLTVDLQQLCIGESECLIRYDIVQLVSLWLLCG